MGVFPRDFSGLLFAVAILEGVFAILKSKFENKCVYLTALMTEITCAATQSTALLLTVAGGGYSRLEIAAAWLTVLLDANLLVAESKAVKEIRVLGETKKASKYTGIGSCVTAVILGI